MVLSQAEENKNRIISLGISLLVFALLLLFLIYYIIVTPNPPFPETPGGGGGIEFNIGNLIEGTGNVENDGIGDAIKVVDLDPTDVTNTNVLLLSEEEKQDRIFENWSMAYHELSENDSVNIDKLLFVNNLITLSDLIVKPTQTSRLFWLMAKQLLQQ